MSLWKQFCRTLESDVTRRHFGPLAEQIDCFAVFMLDEVQSEAVWETTLETDEEGSPIPPFPFPKMCLIHTNGIVAFDQPEVDEDDTLKCSLLLFTDEPTRILALATITVPECAETYADFVLDDLRGIHWAPFEAGQGDFFDQDHPLPHHPISPEEIAKERKKARHQIEVLEEHGRSEADALLVKELQGHIETLDRLQADVGRLQEEMTENNQKMTTAIHELCQMEFSRSLLAIVYINQHFVLETAQGKIRPPGKPTKKRKKKRKVMRRLHEREHYIAVTRKRLRYLWHESQKVVGRASPVPHLRRGHYRTLATEKGRRTWVRPHAVGGEVIEWRNGDIYYRVVQ